MNKLSMDTPMLREAYRKARANTIRYVGGTNFNFDMMVKLGLRENSMKPEPENYVLCALDIEKEAREKYQQIVAIASEMNYFSGDDKKDAAMEDKYDFNKEN